MEFTTHKSALSGAVDIPASKSHTIRALVIASLAEGKSKLVQPLHSLDTEACVDVCRALGARIEVGDDIVVAGTAGALAAPDDVLDVKNSGTTLYVALAMASLLDGAAVFTGDEQIRKRPAGNLIDALNDLGANVWSTRGNGMTPIVVQGPLRGGRTSIECPSSQYLTALLISTPLAPEPVVIDVPLLHEQPYVHITLGWLDEQGIRYERDALAQFRIEPGQGYRAFEKRIAADFSSATFFLVAAAITGSELTLMGLDMNDAQGDKAVVHMLAEMGAEVEVLPDGVRIAGRELKGGEFDMNATPDALPAMAVAASFAEGETRLVNVPQARLKETDRIAVMHQELAKLGVQVEELEDGLAIQGGSFKGGSAHGHGDHRVVMALAVAGLASPEPVTVDTAEAASITFPNFAELVQSVGGRIEAR